MSKNKFHISDMGFKILSAMLAVILSAGIAGMPAMAAGSVKSTQYEGDGKVEVEFDSAVNYENVMISVKDASGTDVKASIVEKDDEDLNFVISDFTFGETYSYTIEGILIQGDKKSSPVTGTITIPQSDGAVKVEQVSYDEDSQQVTIEFDERVEWENPTAVITSGAYNKVTGIDEYEDGAIKISVDELTKGKVYRYTINGVRKRNSSEPFGSVTGAFSY